MCSSIFVIGLGEYLLKLVAPDHFWVDPIIIKLLCSSFLLTGIRKNLFMIIWFHKKIWILLILYCVLPVALNVGLNILFVPTYGIIAAAVSTLISAFLIVIVSSFVIRYFHFN